MKTLFFYCLCLLLPYSSTAQDTPTLTLEMVNKIKENSPTVIKLDAKKIPFRAKYVLRFMELGTIYNPDFPNTRNQVLCTNFHKVGTQFSYIGKSVSTHRSTIIIDNLTGKFTSVWRRKDCISLVEYEVTRKGEFLEITGKVYTCLLES